MNTETAYKVYETEEEFLNSPELERIYSGYVNDEKKYAGRWTEFIKAFVVADDRYSEYGMDFKVYKLVKVISSGMLSLKEVSSGSMLTSAPMQIVNIEGDTITFTDAFVKKTEEGRQFVAKNELIVK